MFTDRKSSYKLPPTTIRDRLVSQEARRNKALEEQKRRRAQKIDSVRQLDLFAGLTLGTSDDEDGDAEPSVAPGHPVDGVHGGEIEIEEGNAIPAPGSVAQYAAMLNSSQHQDALDRVAIARIPSQVLDPSTERILSPPAPVEDPPVTAPIELESESSKPRTSKKRRGGASKQKRRTNKPSKWADKCMYAELLEMVSDQPWGPSDGDEIDLNDGLPKDLESAWVALAPVPAGKRCLAVTHTSAGVSGLVPNTTLRSRLLGKTLLARFPSILPPLTVLDCILDKRWRENGIVHVLDVVRWKGQDVGDCESGFRFWWRDMRLAELGQPIQLKQMQEASCSGLTQEVDGQIPDPSSSQQQQQRRNKYTFPYPTSFIPVPYHADTSLTVLDAEIIPAARSWRFFSVPLPAHLHQNAPGEEAFTNGQGELGMDIEPPLLLTAASTPTSSVPPSHPAQPSFIKPAAVLAHVEPDGLLLYVSEASYEPGTSPLSSWIPIHPYQAGPPDEVADKVPDASAEQPTASTGSQRTEGSLDLFHRLVKRQLHRRLRRAVTEVEMDDGAASSTPIDAEMDTDI